MKYAIYARKSSEAKEKQALSIDDQLSECTTYAKQNNLDVAYILKEAKSSFKPGIREQFDLMIELLQNKSVDAILTWKPDRLCRNPEEGGKILQMLQDRKIQEIRTPTGDIYNPDSDHLILQIHFGMANQYSRNLSQNVKRGLKYKVERGEFPRRAIVGYEGIGLRGQRQMRPESIESAMIKEAFNMAEKEKFSLQQMCDLLKEKGLRTKHGKVIGRSHLVAILTNPTYYGYYWYKGELIKGTFEPIIDKLQFDAVQKALGNRSKPKKIRWDDYHAYQGLVYCGTCGCMVTTTVKKKEYKISGRTAYYAYHHCTKRRGNCRELSMMPDELEKEVLRRVSEIKIDQDVWNLGMKLLRAKHHEEANKISSHLLSYQQHFNSLQDKLNRLIDMRADGELTKDEFVARKSLLFEEQARAKSLMNDAEHNAKHWIDKAEEFFNTALQAREIIEHGNVEDRRKLLNKIGEKLLLHNKRIDIRLKQPYDILLKNEYRTNGLPLWDCIRTVSL